MLIQHWWIEGWLRWHTCFIFSMRDSKPLIEKVLIFFNKTQLWMLTNRKSVNKHFFSSPASWYFNHQRSSITAADANLSAVGASTISTPNEPDPSTHQGGHNTFQGSREGGEGRPGCGCGEEGQHWVQESGAIPLTTGDNKSLQVVDLE